MSKLLKTITLILIALIIFLGGYQYYQNYLSKYRYYQIIAHSSLHGMVVSSPVEMLGVEIGSVNSIELIDAKSAMITIQVQKSVPMKNTIEAQIIRKGLSGKGFTGYVYIVLQEQAKSNKKEFDLLIPSSNIKHDYPIIPLVAFKDRSLDLGFEQINTNVTALTARLNRLLDNQSIALIHRILANLKVTTQLMVDNNNKLKQLIANFSTVGYHLAPLSRNANATLSSLDSQLLPELYKTVNSINILSKQLTASMNLIGEDPSVVIRGVKISPKGPGEK